MRSRQRLRPPHDRHRFRCSVQPGFGWGLLSEVQVCRRLLLDRATEGRLYGLLLATSRADVEHTRGGQFEPADRGDVEEELGARLILDTLQAQGRKKDRKE